MAAFLVTGNPGSGKTSVALELARRGHEALDADEIAGWQTATGEPVSPPEHPSDEWLLSHRWAWSRSRVLEAIGARGSTGRHIFVCGISMNQREMFDLFELVFLLSLDDATQLMRLDTPSNAHRNQAQRAQIIKGREVFEQETRTAGAVVLDGRLPTGVVADRIEQEARRAAAGPR